MDKAGQYARLQGLMALRSSGFGHPTSRLSGSLKKSVLIQQSLIKTRVLTLCANMFFPQIPLSKAMLKTYRKKLVLR